MAYGYVPYVLLADGNHRDVDTLAVTIKTTSQANRRPGASRQASNRLSLRLQAKSLLTAIKR